MYPGTPPAAAHSDSTVPASPPKLQSDPRKNRRECPLSTGLLQSAAEPPARPSSDPAKTTTSHRRPPAPAHDTQPSPTLRSGQSAPAAAQHHVQLHTAACSRPMHEIPAKPHPSPPNPDQQISAPSAAQTPAPA